MRDLRHLEELSSATAFGSWANDVVVALDRVREGENLADADRATIGQAAGLLEAVLQPNARRHAPDMARSLAAGETTKRAIAAVFGPRPSDENRAKLAQLAAVATRAAKGTETSGDGDRLDEMIDLFDRLGDLQLVKSNAVLSARRRAVTWTGTQPT